MITVYNFEQGTDEWIAARLGLLTASDMKHILTPTLKIANNDKTRSHLYELLAQRISGFVEPHYIGEEMLRGETDEVTAREIYDEEYAPVHTAGFITNAKWGFTLGYSPDALVGDDGLIEIKSRRQKFQIETIIDQEVPEEHRLQIQTGLLVSERKWCDYISYSAGLPMATIRVYPDEQTQSAILAAAKEFEEKLSLKLSEYNARISDSNNRLIPTERTIIQEIMV